MNARDMIVKGREPGLKGNKVKDVALGDAGSEIPGRISRVSSY